MAEIIISNMRTENKEKLKNYHTKYRKRNKEKIKRINDKYRRIHRNKRNRQRRERWNSSEEFRKKRKEYWHTPRMKEKYKIYYQRRNIKNELKWDKMHISKKIINRLNKVLKELESAQPTGTMDLNYQKQIKLRLNACEVLCESWHKEFKLMESHDEPKEE